MADSKHLVILTGILIGAFGLAGCQGSGGNSDSRLQDASPAAIQERIRSTCQVSQAQLQNVELAKVSKKCGCYAGKTFKAMTPAEVDSMRATGVFNESARAKALAAIDACGLKRP